MVSENLIIDRAGAIATIWLNRPSVLNALSTDLLGALIDAVSELDSDPEIAVIVLMGKGRAFSSGTDLSEIARLGDSHDAMWRFEQGEKQGEKVVRTILECRATSVIAVHGYCIGGGLSIAMAADICIAAEGTEFFIPELGLGVAYLWGSTPMLTVATGIGRARALILTGDRFDAAYARDIGLVYKVFPLGELFAAATDLAARLAAKPRRAREKQKRLANRFLLQAIETSRDEAEFQPTRDGGNRTPAPAAIDMR